MLLKEDTYMYLYEKKTMYNKTIELQKEITTQTQWDYFKPPLNEMKMKDENITISNLTINNIQKKETQLTIKFMELLNKIILEQGNIENDKYIPTPIDNVCCLEEINNSAIITVIIPKSVRNYVSNCVIRIQICIGILHFMYRFLQCNDKYLHARQR